MTSGELSAEICAAHRRLTPAHRARLLGAGVSPAALLWWVGALPAVIEGACWWPATGADEAFIVPVFCADDRSSEWPDPDESVRFGDLIDAVAFRLEEPDKWALRLGVARWLGAIEPQLLILMPEPVTVHQTPLDWLRADGAGLVPLSREPRDIQNLLLTCRSITVSSVSHGKSLRWIMERPFPIPQIYVETPERKTAA